MTASARLRTRLSALLLVTGAMLVFASTASALATRTWVSGVGDDANPCSRTAPCKTFAGAISKTAEGGEINALDPGGYGAVTITKSITINGLTQQGSILNGGVTGVLVNGANVDVVLRNLDINAGGAAEPLPAPPACRFAPSSTGVRVLQARSVRMDGVNVWSQARGGIEVVPSASATAVLLNRVSVQNTCGFGIKAAPTGTGKVQLDGVDVSVAGNEVVGVTVGDGSVARFARSTFQQNKLALEATGAGQLVSLGGNVLSGNDDGDDSNDAVTNGDDGRFTAMLDAPTVVTVPTPVNVPGPVVTVNTPTPLVVAIGVDPAPTVPGRRVVVPYASTVLANATLQVKLGGKVVDTVDGVAKRGRNSIAWDGKLAGGKLAAPGTYSLVLRLTGADGQTDTDTVSVKVVKPRATASAAAAKPVRKPVRR